MTISEQQQIDAIDADRRNKEAILLALLLLLCEDAENAARAAIIAGGPIEAAIRTALAGIPGVRPGMAEVLKQGADAGYHAGIGMADTLVPPPPIAGIAGEKKTPGIGGRLESDKSKTADAYKGQVDVDELTNAIVRRVMVALGVSPTSEDVGPAFDAAGASGDNQTLLIPVATTAVGAGYNPGLFFGWADNPKVLGLRFENPDDSATTKICRARIGVQLPKHHPWWKTSCPPCHWGCRSSLSALTSKFTMTANPPDLPAPATGFGFAPVGAFTLSRAAAPVMLSAHAGTWNLSGAEELTGGDWRTINGARVYIKDGVAI